MPIIEKVGNCSKCGKPAAWNLPCLDVNRNLLCDTCSQQSQEIVRGVSQFTEDGAYKYKNVWRKRNVTIMGYTAWVGHPQWPLTEAQRKMIDAGRVEELIDGLLQREADGFFVCTSCKQEFPHTDIGGRPLFAGRACKSCWAKTSGKN